MVSAATVLLLASIPILLYVVRVLTASPAKSTLSRVALVDRKTEISATLAEKTQVSHNSARYKFALPGPSQVLGLPIGQHITVSATINGDTVSRSYTPTTLDSDETNKGFFELLIKTYPDGKLSTYFAGLKLGDKIKVKGPRGQFHYTPGCVSRFGMIAGGTGITPMYQIIQAVLKNPQDDTRIDLIYGNVTEEDILLREELDTLVDQHPNRFSVYHVLNNPPEGWKGGVGFITGEMIQSRFPKTEETSAKVLLCGPPPMTSAMAGILVKQGFPKPKVISKMTEQVFIF